MKTETWYVMEDGSMGDPREVSPGEDGLLRHKDGRVVAYAPHGPRSRSIDPQEEVGSASQTEKPKKGRQMEPDGESGKYKTR